LKLGSLIKMETSSITLNGNQLSKIFSMFENRFEDRFLKIERLLDAHEKILEFLKQQIQSFNYLVSSMKSATELNQSSSKFSEELQALITEASMKVSLESAKIEERKLEETKNPTQETNITLNVSNNSNRKQKISEENDRYQQISAVNKKECDTHRSCERKNDRKHQNEFCDTCSAKASPGDSVKTPAKNITGFKLIGKKSPKKASNEKTDSSPNKNKGKKIRPLSVLSDRNSSTRSPSESSRGSKGEKKFVLKEGRENSMEYRKKATESLNTSLNLNKTDRSIKTPQLDSLLKERKASPNKVITPKSRQTRTKTPKKVVEDEEKLNKEIAEFKSILSKNLEENTMKKIKKNNSKQAGSGHQNSKLDSKNIKPRKDEARGSTVLKSQKPRDSLDDINGPSDPISQRTSIYGEKNPDELSKGRKIIEEKPNNSDNLGIDNEFLTNSMDLTNEKRKNNIHTPSFGDLQSKNNTLHQEDLEETPRRLSVTRQRNSPEEKVNQHNDDEDGREVEFENEEDECLYSQEREEEEHQFLDDAGQEEEEDEVM
jgi:hypothetical protein